MNTIDIPIEKLHISPHNTRQPKPTDPAVKELAKSLANAGQTAAILVRPHPQKKGHYEIAAGARRSVAAAVAGLKTLRASVTEMDEDTFQKAILVDNLQRENPDPRAEAELLLKLHERGNTAVEIAAHMGKPESWVARRLKLLAVIPKFLKEWRDPESNFHHFSIDMMELVGSLTKTEQEELLEKSWGIPSTRAELLEQIRRQSPSLESAPFDLHDPKFFVKDCGPGCASDSSKQALIFDFKEGKKKDCARCLNGACFNKRLSLYIDSEYDRLCEVWGKKLPVYANCEVKGQRFKGFYQYDGEMHEKPVDGAEVVFVVDDQKPTLRWLKKRSDQGKVDRANESPDQKRERLIKQHQGKRWSEVRKRLEAHIEAADISSLTIDIDRLVATFGTAYRVTGPDLEKGLWEQVFSVEDSYRDYSDAWGWKYGRRKKPDATDRRNLLWKSLQSSLTSLIPMAPGMAEYASRDQDYIRVGKLVGFDAEAEKLKVDLEYPAPKTWGDVDPHTLQPK
jgi:ParB/RepB/Spo0J family partition protein